MSKTKKHSEHVLGYYEPGGLPIVISPVLNANPNSDSTLVHEQAHEWLTTNTPFGVLSQILEHRVIREPWRRRQADACRQAQWGCQEGFATYLEMCYLVSSTPSSFDAAVGALPTAALGGPAYREWYYKFDAVMPLEGISSGRHESRNATRYALIANALAAYAMHGDVLARYRSPEDLTTDAFEAYLKIEGPDLRLQRAIDILRNLDGLWEAVWQDTNCADLASCSAAGIIERLAASLPSFEFMKPAAWSTSAEEFARSWRAQSAPPHREASVVYPADWMERVSFPNHRLSKRTLGQLLLNPGGDRQGLLLSVAMHTEREAHLSTLPFPLGGTEEETWALMLRMLNQGAPSAEGVFSTRALTDLLREHQQAPVHLSFIRQSWRHWDQAVPSGCGLDIRSEAAIEVELSRDSFVQLLEFRDLRRSGKWRIFPVSGDQYAAIIIDLERPTSYALQSVQGEAGLSVFGMLVEKLGIEMLPMGLKSISGWPTIRLNAQGLLP